MHNFEMVTLTEGDLRAGASERGGFNREQLAAIGVEWPPARGWLKELVGTQLPALSLSAFQALKS